MSKTRINYKSDFSLDVTFAINKSAVPLPTNDFLVRFFVDGAPGVSYVCGYKDGEYINCEKKDDDTLTCYIDNHKFGCGRLCCEFVDLEENEKFTDKIQKTVTPCKLDIVLVDGAGDSSTSISASVMVDIEAVIAGLREALEGIEQMQDDIETLQGDMASKLDFYDASWIDVEEERTVENFNALYEVSSTDVFVLYNMWPAEARKASLNSVVVRGLQYQRQKYVVVSLSNEEVSVSIVTRDGLVTEDELDERLESLATKASLEALVERVADTEEWQETAGNPASLPHYHSANWLEDEQGSVSEEHPERRLKVRYTSMLKAINDNRLLKQHNVTASGVDYHKLADDGVGEEPDSGIISVVFMTTDAFGTSKTMVYFVRYSAGDNYCTVEKNEVPMPYYDATWATSYGGTLEQLEQFIDVINSTPRSLIIAGNQPVVRAVMRSAYVVQFSVMIDGGMRTYTTEYSSGAGETTSTYEDVMFQTSQ